MPCGSWLLKIKIVVTRCRQRRFVSSRLLPLPSPTAFQVWCWFARGRPVERYLERGAERSVPRVLPWGMDKERSNDCVDSCWKVVQRQLNSHRRVNLKVVRKQFKSWLFENIWIAFEKSLRTVWIAIFKVDHTHYIARFVHNHFNTYLKIVHSYWGNHLKFVHDQASIMVVQELFE